jgi:hypothetical protein
MCEFVDDSLSAFKFNDLIACGCGLVEWTDFNPEVARPRCTRVRPSPSSNATNCAGSTRAAGRVHQGGPRPLYLHLSGHRRQGRGSGVYQLLAKPGAMPGCAVARIEYWRLSNEQAQAGTTTATRVLCWRGGRHGRLRAR